METPTAEWVGPFWVPFALDAAKRRLFEQRLLPFWTMDALRSIFVPIVAECNPVSLRMLDWLCTNYAKRRSVVCLRRSGPDTDVEFVDICQRYKNECTEFRRAGFDPFARAHGKQSDDWILRCDIDGRTFKTTVAQLNFLRWAHENEVLRYASDHRAEIAAEMRENQAIRRQKTTTVAAPTEPSTRGARKRKQITMARSPQCRVFSVGEIQHHVYGGRFVGDGDGNGDDHASNETTPDRTKTTPPHSSR